MNRLKAYCRRTILRAARDNWGLKRRTPESTKGAFQDALQGTNTGWWNDLIYTSDMLAMAHRYRQDIATALGEYRDATGESYIYRPHHRDDPEFTAKSILSALMRPKAFTFAEYHECKSDAPEAALTGLRFAVEWYAGELAREYAPDL